jgi:hypothetical protein
MTTLHDDLLTVLDAVRILSPTRFSLRGSIHEAPCAITSNGAAPTDVKEAPIVPELSRRLYGQLYTRRTTPDPVPSAGRLAQRDLLAAVSAANHGRGTFEPGWTIRRLEQDGRIAVDKDELTFWVHPKGLRVASGEIRPGVPCWVRIPKEQRYLNPDFYTALGDAEDDSTGDAGVVPLVRYYWHLTPAAAVPLVAAATTLLNASGVPFRLKVLSDPSNYHRADAGVLYIRRSHVERTSDALAGIYTAVASGLRPETPLFTKPLASGLGVAEDPVGEMSFGQHRCRLVGQALWQAFVEGRESRDDRATALAGAFEQAGFDPLRPHLGPGSQTDYDVLPLAHDGDRCELRGVGGQSP